MNWDAIAAVGQMLGSVAVFVTLGYLAVQVRHARDEVRRSISTARSVAIRELHLTRATSETLNTAYKNANAAVGGSPGPFVSQLMASGAVTYEQAEAVNRDQFGWFNHRHHLIPHVDEMPAGDRAWLDLGILNYRNSPLLKLWYESSKPSLPPDAVSYVDNLLAQPG